MLQRLAKLAEDEVRRGVSSKGGKLSKWEVHLRALVIVKVGRVLSHPLLDGKCVRFELWVDNDTPPEVPPRVVLRYFRPVNVPQVEGRLTAKQTVVGLDYEVPSYG